MSATHSLPCSPARFRTLIPPYGSVEMSEKAWNRGKRPCGDANPLKSPKTAKGIFGKVWRFQAESLEIFGNSLEKLAAYARPSPAAASACRPSR
jgi:hypothetical protein